VDLQAAGLKIAEHDLHVFRAKARLWHWRAYRQVRSESAAHSLLAHPNAENGHTDQPVQFSIREQGQRTLGFTQNANR